MNIYYTGHGSKGTGNWVTSDNKHIAAQDVLETIYEAGFCGKVGLWLDCCFSGHWSFEIERLLKEKTHPITEFKDILIHTSTDRLHSGIWGEWSKSGFNWADDQAYKRKYGSTVGLIT